MQTFTFYASDDKLQNRGNTASEKIGVSTIGDKLLSEERDVYKAGQKQRIANALFHGLYLKISQCFPTLGKNVFSRAWDWLHIFPRLELVTYFPALGTGYIFSRAWDWLHVFPCLGLVTYFPAIGTGQENVFRSWDWLHVFPRFTMITCFPALDKAGCMVSRACNWSHATDLLTCDQANFNTLSFTFKDKLTSAKNWPDRRLLPSKTQ